jgi:hypothetical protein
VGAPPAPVTGVVATDVDEPVLPDALALPLTETVGKSVARDPAITASAAM